MKRCIDTITSVLCVSNIVVLIVLKMKVTKLEKRYRERIEELIDYLVDAECNRDDVINEWYFSKKISSKMYEEYCKRHSKKDD